jgi:Tfp pilus assembly protein PilN
MIKINLLPQKRAKQKMAGLGGGPRPPSQNDMLYGVVGLVAFAAIIFFVVDKPKRDDLGDARDRLKTSQARINDLNTTLAGGSNELSYKDLQKAEADAKARADAINRLMSARVVPANVLHELGRILTPREVPTMTEAMVKKTGTGPESDPNKRFQVDWDPTHVWMTSFQDTQGAFKLEGGAQSESDVTQLSKRLAASAYFYDVIPSGLDRTTDNATGQSYYKFTITGKVAY